MTAGFLLSFVAQVVAMVFALIDILRASPFSLYSSPKPKADSIWRAAFIGWSAALGMCVATRASPIFIAVWAAPVRVLYLLLLLLPPLLFPMNVS